MPRKLPLLSSRCTLSSTHPDSVGRNVRLTVFSRKKYAKMKMKFTKQELESEALIREELRIEDLSKRIQEQNE